MKCVFDKNNYMVFVSDIIHTSEGNYWINIVAENTKGRKTKGMLQKLDNVIVWDGNTFPLDFTAQFESFPKYVQSEIVKAVNSKTEEHKQISLSLSEAEETKENVSRDNICNNDNNDLFLVLFDYEKENDFSVLKPVFDQFHDNILTINIIERMKEKIVEIRVLGEKIADTIVDFSKTVGLTSGIVAIPE